MKSHTFIFSPFLSLSFRMNRYISVFSGFGCSHSLRGMVFADAICSADLTTLVCISPDQRREGRDDALLLPGLYRRCSDGRT